MAGGGATAATVPTEDLTEAVVLSRFAAALEERRARIARLASEVMAARGRPPYPWEVGERPPLPWEAGLIAHAGTMGVEEVAATANGAPGSCAGFYRVVRTGAHL